MSNVTQITDIIGKTISHIDARQGAEECIFTFTDNTRFRFYHEQDCCENVYIEDIIGELTDLLNEPLLMAEEVSNDQAVDVDIPSGPYDDSRTWTFYKFATVKGYVTFRWLGSSNGYYSESVSYGFMPTEEEEKAEELKKKELIDNIVYPPIKRRPLKKQLKVLKTGKEYTEDIVIFGDLYIKGKGNCTIPNLTVYKGTVHVKCDSLTIMGYLNIDNLYMHAKKGINKC